MPPEPARNSHTSFGSRHTKLQRARVEALIPQLGGMDPGRAREVLKLAYEAGMVHAVKMIEEKARRG